MVFHLDSLTSSTDFKLVEVDEFNYLGNYVPKVSTDVKCRIQKRICYMGCKTWNITRIIMQIIQVFVRQIVKSFAKHYNTFEELCRLTRFWDLRRGKELIMVLPYAKKTVSKESKDLCKKNEGLESFGRKQS